MSGDGSNGTAGNARAPAEVVEIPLIVSVDDHVIEPPDLWQRWLPRQLAERGPRVERRSYRRLSGDEPRYCTATEGPTTDFWVYEGSATAIHNGFAAAGLKRSAIDRSPVAYDEMRPGFFQVKPRLEDMDVNHVERSLCFPTFPRFCGQTFLEASDRELALACVRAYNDWTVDEWCGDSGGRLIPLCLVPLWDARLAADEVRRNAGRGVRAVAFTELPAQLDLPSIHDRAAHWDPLWRACDETGTVVCIHIGSSSKFLSSSPDAPLAVRMSVLSLNSMLCMSDWLLSGLLPRFPNLKVAFSESQIGWMPFLFERIDNVWLRSREHAHIHPAIIKRPSSYVPGRIYGCFFDDDFGLESRRSIGVDQITFESDYPHQDSLWPHTRDYAERVMADLEPEEIHKIVRGNAIAMLGLPETLGS